MAEGYLDQLKSYLPRSLLSRVSNDAPISPSCTSVSAAVAFVDISGFSSLSEEYAKLGEDGVEQVSKFVGAYFAELIEAIDAHGGDVIKFAGDALLITFQPEENENSPTTLKDSAERSIHCALDIQSNFASYKVNDSLSLTVHIAGGENGIWEFLVAGKPVNELSDCVDAAKRGEVALTAKTWELLKDSATWSGEQRGNQVIVTYSQTSQPHKRPTPNTTQRPKQSEAFMKHFLQPIVTEQLQSKQFDWWMAELRTVTVLFVNIASLQFRSEQDLRSLNQALRIMQRAIWQLGGFIRQFLVDDKGTVFIAAFGVRKHTDDAVRAVTAARRIQTDLHHANISHSIGVTSGTAFCGNIGSQVRKEFALVGSCVNLSARLMKAGHDTDAILCDLATYTRTKDAIAYTALPEITVKGKKEPVAIFTPVKQREIHDHSAKQQAAPVTAGRTDELRRCGDLLQTFKRSNDALTLIINGPAGIGKSQMLGEIRALCPSNSLSCLCGQAVEVESSTPLYCFRTVVQEMLALDELSSYVAYTRGNTSARVPAEFVRAAPLLNQIIGSDLPETAYTAGLDDAQRSLATLTVVLHLVRTVVAHGSMVMMIEDVHWADSLSWEMLLQLSEIRGLMLVVTSRVGETALSHFAQTLAQKPGTITMLLQPLQEKAVEALILNKYSAKKVDPLLTSSLSQRSGGNPFFIEQMLFSLEESKALVLDGSDVKVKTDFERTLATSVPVGIQELIVSRVDRLNPTLRLLLKVASVVGFEFSVAALNHLAPEPAEESGLANLVNNAFIVPMAADQYVFKHKLIQEAVYSIISHTQKQSLHLCIAEWIENSEANLERLYPLLAAHYRAAGVPRKAIHYYVKAGLEAFRVSASLETIDFFSSALELDATLNNKHINQHSDWLFHIAEAYARIGTWEKCELYCDKVLTLCGYPHYIKETQSFKGIRAVLYEVLKQFIHVWAPRRFFHNTLKGREQEVAAQAARVYYLIWFAVSTKGIDAPECLFKTLNAADLCGSLSTRVMCCSGLMFASTLFNLTRIANYYQCEAKLTFDSGPISPEGLFSYHLLHVSSLMTKLRFHDQLNGANWEEHLNLMREISTARGATQDLNVTDIVFSCIHVCYQTDFDKLWTNISVALQGLLIKVNHTGMPWLWTYAVYIALEQNLLKEAAAVIERFDTYTVRENRLNMFQLETARALYLLRTDVSSFEHACEAYDWYTQKVELPTGWPMHSHLDRLYYVFVALYEATQSGQAIDLLPSQEKLTRMCKAAQGWVEKVTILLNRGRFAWAQGDHNTARKLWLQSKQRSQLAENRFCEALCLYELGRHSADASERRTQLQQAETMLQQMQATYWVECVRKALGDQSQTTTKAMKAHTRWSPMSVALVAAVATVGAAFVWQNM